MKKYIKFNMNDNIKVKFTENGLREHKRQWKLWHDECPQVFKEYKLPIVDENGYSTFQMWVFMQNFGDSIEMGFQPIVETDILIEVDTLQNEK